jgi:hypothetical protein
MNQPLSLPLRGCARVGHIISLWLRQNPNPVRTKPALQSTGRRINP